MHVWPQDGLSDTSPRPRPTQEDYTAAASFCGLTIIPRDKDINDPIRDRYLQNTKIKEGDLYLAGRNTGIKLLTAKYVDVDRGWIVPVEEAYSFNTAECVLVKEL